MSKTTRGLGPRRVGATNNYANVTATETVAEFKGGNVNGESALFDCRLVQQRTARMYSTPHKAIGALRLETIEILSWYEEPNDDQCLYTPCLYCNPQMHIPDGLEPLDTIEVVGWYCTYKPMQPDYAALAAEKPALASLIDRDSAGLEG